MSQYLTQRKTFTFKNYGASVVNKTPTVLPEPMVHAGKWLLLGLSTYHNQSGAPTTWNLTLSNSMTGESITPTPTYEYSVAPSVGNRMGYFILKADFDIDTILMVANTGTNEPVMAGVAFEFILEPEGIKNQFLTSSSLFSTTLNKGDRVLCLSEDATGTPNNMTPIVSGEFGIQVYEHVAEADGAASMMAGSSVAGASNTRFYLHFRGVGEQISVLDSGIEVPLSLDGMYDSSAFNVGSPLVTSADLHFDGKSEPASRTVVVSRTNTLATSYCVWVKWNSVPAAATGIISHQPATSFATNNNNLYVQATGLINFNTSSGNTTADISGHFADGQWHHYVFTVSGNTHRFYADGAFMVEKVLSKTATTNTAVRFGTMYSGTTQYGPIDGLVEDSAVLSTVLTPEQVASIHAAGRDNNGLVSLTWPTFMEQALHRYWETAGYEAGINSALSISEMVNVPNDMESAYSVDLSAYISSYTKNGYTTDAVLIDAPGTKPAYLTMVGELAKYPRGFIASSDKVNGISLAANLRTTSGGVGGVAFSDIGVAMVNTTENPGTRYYGTVFRDVDFVFHHELAHLLNFSWPSEVDAMESSWVSLGGAYIGSSYENLPVGVRPQGFVRDYGRFSFMEDFADVMAVLMTTSMQADLASWLTTDTVLAEKVRMVKEWLGAKSTAMANPRYFTAIHEGGT